MQYTTTFALLRQHGACASGYRKLAEHLGSVDAYGERKPIPLAVILESNGVEDAIWCLRATEENCDREARLLACDCAESALPIFERERPGDLRPRQAIEVARRYAVGEASDSERDAAWDAVGDAAWDAARYAAWAAARDAAWAAARAAAGDAVGDAAWDAARYAAWAAARAAARDATRDATRAAVGDAQADLFRARFCQDSPVEVPA